MASNIRSIPTGELDKPFVIGASGNQYDLSGMILIKYNRISSSQYTHILDLSYIFNESAQAKLATCAFAASATGTLKSRIVVGPYTLTGNNGSNAVLPCIWKYISSTSSTFYTLDGSLLLNVSNFEYEFAQNLVSYGGNAFYYKLYYRIDEYR